MAVHEKFAKAGPPNIALRSGEEVVVYSHQDVIAIDAVLETPLSVVANSFEDTVAAEDWIARGPADILSIDILATEASATDGVVVEESDDGTLIKAATLNDVVADVRLTVEVPLVATYFRFRYTNGAAATDDETQLRVAMKKDMAAA